MDQISQNFLENELQKDFDDFLEVYGKMIDNGKVLHLAVSTFGLDNLEKIFEMVGMNSKEKAERKYNEIIENANKYFNDLENLFKKVGYANFIKLLLHTDKLEEKEKPLLAKYVWEFLLSRKEKNEMML
jgi:hypothetical protein